MLAPCLCAVAAAALAPARADAQPDVGTSAPEPTDEPAAAPERPAAPLILGAGALPGGLHAPGADTLPRGTFAAMTLGGFGWRSGLVGADHRLHRVIGDLGLAFAPLAGLSIALQLDGRYDHHAGVTPEGDDNYVGDPRLLVRLAKAAGSARLGAQLVVWAPGKDAPSIAPEAISVEARALASLRAGPGSVGFSAGFRLDNSASSVDDPMLFRAHERVSLGVSEYNAIVAGAFLTMPAGTAFFGAEASADVFVGGPGEAPGPVLRAGIHGGLHVSKQLSLIAFAELAKVPAIDAADLAADDFALIAYEPMITGGLGLTGQFGGARPRPGLAAHVKANKEQRAITVIEYAEIAGTVTDDVGQPIVGATVTAKLKAHTATGVTGAKGEYTITAVPIGKTVNGVTTLDDTGAEVSVAVANKKPGSMTITLAKGKNHLAKLELQPLLPPGQLKAVVRAAATGKPLAATLKIEPGGITATSGADGTLSVDLPPGSYKATATAPGHKPQTLDVTVDPNGVAIKNFELSK